MDETIDQLMHAVLDGEANATQARTLEKALAADPAARERFEELKRLFEALEQVPELSPPADLADAVVKRAELPSQPFRWPRVSDALNDFFMGGMTMSNRRTVFAGISLAAVAIVIGGYYVLDKPSKNDLSGTVAPATRYRAEQIQSHDVKLGDQTVAQLLQNEAVDKLIKDPSFQKLASNQQAMEAFAANIQAYAAMVAASPQAFNVMANNAQAFQAFNNSAQVFQVIANNAQAFQAFNNSPQVFQLIASSPQAFQ